MPPETRGHPRSVTLIPPPFTHSDVFEGVTEHPGPNSMALSRAAVHSQSPIRNQPSQGRRPIYCKIEEMTTNLAVRPLPGTG
jgi:hypothetical protein